MMKKLLFPIGLLLLAQWSVAQPFGQDDLDYYLLQSFLASDSKQRLSLNHIGIQGQFRNDEYLVTAVLEGYPAHAAGIERGDVISMAEGEAFHPVWSLNLELNGSGEFIPVTSELTLRIKRGDNDREVSVLPVYENLFDSYRTATSNSVLEFAAGNKVIGYVRFWALSRSTNDMISYQQLISSLDHCDGIIFDLRNGFGFLDSQHLDLVFNDKNNYFSVSNPPDSAIDFADISPELQFDNYRKPIALLLNEDTRGGAELFAYQLDKLERVISLGSNTAGKIGEYIIEESSDSAVMQYQSADQILIDGKLFEGVGVKPESEVDFPYESTTRGDPQYNAAVNALMGII